jgi:hypothetical protein
MLLPGYGSIDKIPPGPKLDALAAEKFSAGKRPRET